MTIKICIYAGTRCYNSQST